MLDTLLLIDGGNVITHVEGLLVLEGTEEDQRAGVDVGRPLCRPAENIQRRKPDTPVINVAAREFFDKALHFNLLVVSKGRGGRGERRLSKLKLK